ncbi:MAG TPA: Dabb family protein [Acidimicrobiales bacterium]|nr:Dabb family protein [Acidimicrobiales bacterium]
MVRHIVVFTWKPEATGEAVQALADGLAALPGQIPEILAYTFGPDLGLADDHPDYALAADFADVDAYRRYAQHPAHRRLIDELLKPLLGSRQAVQIEIDG